MKGELHAARIMRLGKHKRSKRVCFTGPELLHLIETLRMDKKIATTWSRRRFPRGEQVPKEAREDYKLLLGLVTRLLAKLRN